MIQRISVRAIIQENNKTLLIRRSTGRPSILGKFELPGGKINYREQPEDAIRRYLRSDVGIHIKTSQLYDAITYIDHDDRNIQYLVLVYIVHLPSELREVELSENYDKYKWFSLQIIQQDALTDLTDLILGILHQQYLADVSLQNSSQNDDKKSTNVEYTIYTDGGSRGNPGPSAAGFIIVDNQQKVVAQGGEYIGITTNNTAEYQGVRLGLEQAIQMQAKRISFKLDSMLVVNQMNGIYKIKNKELWPIHERIRELMSHLEHVSFTHVPREKNQLADGVVNKTLDEHMRLSKENNPHESRNL